MGHDRFLPVFSPFQFIVHHHPINRRHSSDGVVKLTTRWALGSHGSDYETYGLLSSHDLWFEENQTFRKNMSHPYSGSRSKPKKKSPDADGKLSGGLVSCLSYVLILKMEMICSS
jgi:hypothetical protein